MRVYVGKIIPLTPDQYTGHMSQVIYLGGCNWRCSYCNVPNILDQKKCEKKLTSSLLEEMVHGREFIDSVVFNGGEPTEQGKALISLCGLAKEEGLLVKVQTNGSHPGVVQQLLNRGLVNRVGVDVKGLYKEYPEIVGVKDPDVESVKQTLQLVSNSKAQLEIVLPVIEGVNAEDVPVVVDELAGLEPEVIVLQEFRPGNTVDPDFKGKSPSYSKLKELADQCKDKANIHLRTKLYGEEKA